MVTQRPLQQQQPHRARHVGESPRLKRTDPTDEELLSFCCCFYCALSILPRLAPASSSFSSSSSSSQSGPRTPVLLRQALMQLLPGRIQLALQCLHILFCQCVRPPVCVCVSVSKCYFSPSCNTLSLSASESEAEHLSPSPLIHPTSSFTSPLPHLLPPLPSTQFTLAPPQRDTKHQGQLYNQMHKRSTCDDEAVVCRHESKGLCNSNNTAKYELTGRFNEVFCCGEKLINQSHGGNSTQTR